MFIFNFCYFAIMQKFILLVLIGHVVCSAYVNDQCQRMGQVGQCKLITDCAPAIALVKKGEYPQICGFHRNVPIVCCLFNDTSNKADIHTIKANNLDEIVGEKSRQKCQEYASYVFSIKASPLIGGESMKVDNCQMTPFNSPFREMSREFEFPHTALIGYKRKYTQTAWKCVGSLISENYILTSARCLNMKPHGVAKFVRIGGTYMYKVNNQNYQDFRVINRIKPSRLKQNIYNNIGLLKLDRSVKFGPSARPACLNTKPQIDNNTLIATGWRLDNFDNDQSDILLKASLNQFPYTVCKTLYEENFQCFKGIDEKNQICAGFLNSTEDICPSDTGSPLLTYNKENHCMHDIVAVASFTTKCGSNGYPGIFVNVADYIGWIENIIWS